MKVINIKKLRYIGILLLILTGFFIALPYVFIGPPLPLFSIASGDNINHTVTIEILNSNNRQVFEDTYELAPEGKVTEPKSLWLLFKSSLPFTDNNYVIKATLENNKSETMKTSLDPWTEVSVSIVDSSVFLGSMVV